MKSKDTLENRYLKTFLNTWDNIRHNVIQIQVERNHPDYLKSTEHQMIEHLITYNN